MFRSVIFSSVFKHFGVDTQKWKEFNSLKIIQLLEKTFKLCSYKWSEGYKSKLLVYRTNAKSLRSRVGHGSSWCNHLPQACCTLSKYEGLWRWVHRNWPYMLIKHAMNILHACWLLSKNNEKFRRWPYVKYCKSYRIGSIYS